MKTKHTPEPWFSGDNAIAGSDGATVAYIGSEADGARIVSCVNALEGFNDPTIIREQIRVMRAALAEIASIPKHGEPEEDGSPHAQDWDDNGGYYAIKALHNAIDKARAVIDATKEG